MQDTPIDPDRPLDHLRVAAGRIDDWASARRRLDEKAKAGELEGAYLAGADLRGVDWSAANLRGVDLRGARLDGARFVLCDLRDARLDRAQAEGLDLKGAKLEGARLDFIYAPGVELSECDAREASFVGMLAEGLVARSARFDGANFEDASLERVQWNDVQFSSAKMARADLRYAVLSECEAEEVDLSDSFVAGADISDCDFSKSDLSGADLENSVFTLCTLRGSDFRRAMASETTFVSCVVDGADFRATRVGRDRFQKTDIEEARLESATTDESPEEPLLAVTTQGIPAQPPRNIRLTLEYDGRAYVGWERQKNGQGIQAVLESVIERITQERTTINGSGRTDAGVHSRGQVANFTLRNPIPASDLQRALNALLPDDIAVRDVRDVDLFFHARFSALKKTYRYTILNDRVPRPLERHLYWPVFAALDREAMKAAAERLVGRRDFSAFCREAESYDDCTRTLFTLRVIDRGPFLDIEAEADGFMWNMVRIIVGTLVHVGLGKLNADDIDSILESKDRKRAGPTAPSEGLMLFKVHYPDEE